jgi:hypothetical protein
VIALFKDDHVAEATGTGAKIRGDLLDVLFDLLACAERVAVEDAGFGLPPLIGEICELQEGVEREARFGCG